MTGFPEPPAVGSETDTLLGSLERQRATFAYKCAELPSEPMRQTIGASTLTIGRLMKHLAYMEDINFTRDLAGLTLPEPWASMTPDERSDVVWRSADDDEADVLYRLWEQAVERSRAAVREALRSGGIHMTYKVRPGEPCTLRRLLVDFIEEYGRHTGHADLIRETIDGRVGEDPPGEPYPYYVALKQVEGT
jgi:Protein of unknown function (DUF664)